MTDEPTCGVEAEREACVSYLRAMTERWNPQFAQACARIADEILDKRHLRARAALATPPASPSPTPAAVEELVARLRDTAHGIEAGNVADPHGRKVGLLREAATALSTLVRKLDEQR